MPPKVMRVPGAKVRGEVSQALIVSQSQVPPLPRSASEKAKPAWPATGRPIVAQRFGPVPVAPPWLIVWQPAHLAKERSPRPASAVCR